MDPARVALLLGLGAGLGIVVHEGFFLVAGAIAVGALAVQAPTFFIMGERDEDALRFNQDASKQLRCEKSLAVVPQATHIFQEPGTLEEAARLALNWFRQHLRPRQ